MLRTLVLFLCGLETLVWLRISIGGISAQWVDEDPIGSGIAAAYAIVATLVLFLFVVPARVYTGTSEEYKIRTHWGR